jgi:hypothetical protein
MNTILNYIEQHPQETVRLIGLSYEQFKDVVIQAELQHQHQITEQEKTKIRLNNQGGGRQRHLSVREEILLTLLYLRHSLTFQLVGVQFGVSESKAHTTFHYWIVILRGLLPASLLEQVERYSSNPQELQEILERLEQLVEIGEEESLQEILSKLELLVDSYEQPRERPLDNQEQKKYYSGKKKITPSKIKSSRCQKEKT